MNVGTTENVAQYEHLAIQHIASEPSFECFHNISQVPLKQLHHDLCTVELIKDHLQHFVHPSACHNRIQLKCIQGIILLHCVEEFQIKL